MELATRLVTVLPDTLAALEAGRIDLARAEVLSQETALLDDAGARRGGGAGAGQGGRRGRAVAGPVAALMEVPDPAGGVQVDADAARRRREEAIRDRAVRAWPQGDGTGVLQVIGQDCDIAFADAVITNLALAGPATGPDGAKLSMDQRRVDAFMDLLRRVAFGDQLPQVRAPRDREVGIVVHADTLFGDGPAKNDPGELRGLGAPAPIDPHSAAELARGEIAAGAATRVLLVDGDGVLQRTLRLPKAPPGGWTRDLLIGQVRAALPDLPSTWRPSPTNRPWRSPTTSEPCTPAAPPMTAPASRPAATWTTTSPGPADPPASPTCVHAAGATTSSRPEASCTRACTPTDPSPPQPCSAPPSPPDPNPCPATASARPTGACAAGGS